MIEIKGLYKDYKIKKNVYPALKGIDITFEDRGFVSILGPSGCGKTTLLNVIGGLDRMTKGQLYIDGVDTKDFRSGDWDSYRNHYIGFIFQSFNLIKHISVLKNVEMALMLSGSNKHKSKQKAIEALDKVGLKGLYNKKPNELSGGQMQRVAIARAIVNNPKVILADEPTGALDSETSREIIDILKELSQDHLVIMVTHNIELAEKYSDRIIKMLDGKIIEEKKNDIVSPDKMRSYKKEKSFMSFFTSLSLSFRNLITKYFRTIMTIFAGSIGIVGVTLVLSVSSGVTDYIGEIQKETLYTSPVRVYSSGVTTTEGVNQSKLEEYPDDKIIIVTQNKYNYEQMSNLDGEFIDYINQMDKDKYTIINYNRYITMNICSKVENDGSAVYQKIRTNNFRELADNKDFLESQFEVVDGVLPTEANQIALVVDSYNCISIDVLNSVGFDFSKGTYNTSDLIGKKYRILTNNNYYKKNENGVYSSVSISSAFEKEGNIDIEICGVIRSKKGSSYSLYDGCFMYTSKLTDLIYESCLDSEIVKDQLEKGTSFDVLSGREFEAVNSDTYSFSIDYLYKQRLIEIGAVANVTTVNIYSDSFEDRVYISNYIKSYSKFKEMNVSYSDYMSSIAEDFATFIEILTEVLVIFALISLLVSAIMIAIITYISVIERTKEIGILRSLGSRKIDITVVFCSETLIIGLGSGLCGVGLSYVFSDWINRIVQNIITDNFQNMSGVNTTNFVQFDKLGLLLIVIGSIIITVLAGLIPSIYAAYKDPIKALKAE